ncbi:DPP IV N-terminal domain-containing protein [Mariniblastus sp.]|nr:DPP IV N-terminal domain-containing protein [Mariniblastus sp.]
MEPTPLTFEQLPGYENYRKILKLRRKLTRDGRVVKLRWSADGRSLLFQKKGEQLQLNLTDGSISDADPEIELAEKPKRAKKKSKTPVQRAHQREREPSPDGKWVASYKDNNVLLKPSQSNDQPSRRITTEGKPRLRFGTGCWVYGEELDQDEAMWWSDDSQKLVYYEINEAGMKDYVLTLDNVKRYTRPQATRYPKAGSPNPKVSLWVYDLETEQTQKLQILGPEDQYLFNIRFAPDSHNLLVNRATRRQDTLDVLAIDVDSGTVKPIVSERQETWQHNRPELRLLEDGQRFVWETERSGWKQFELRSIDGTRLNKLTDNEGYPVHQIVSVDESIGWFYYSAFSASNPYNLQLHRCRLDGTECSRITTSPLNHSDFKLSPNSEYVVATKQQLDTPVSTVVYDMTGREIAVLAEGSKAVAEEAQLSDPELFSFTADDGKTTVYGTLHKPSNFSAAKKYPLLVDVYGGPQSKGIENNYRPADPICELGFVVAKVGNRGTINRGKAFEAANYLQLGGPDLDDQASAVEHLASRPYIDQSRVGIYGHSYGGYLSALAMLRHPDVFHVAVSGAPVTDWRNYDTIYTERYMRLPEENSEGYDAGSCVKLADQLKGKLLIVHGLIDDNVHPSNSWQLIKSFHDSDKRFDLMIYPQFAHGIGSTYEALRWEYFVRHLKPEP